MNRCAVLVAICAVFVAGCPASPSPAKPAVKPAALPEKKPEKAPPAPADRSTAAATSAQAAGVTSLTLAADNVEPPPAFDRSNFADVKVGQVYVINMGAHVVAAGQVIQTRTITFVSDKLLVAVFSNRAPTMPRYNETPMEKVTTFSKPERGWLPPPDATKTGEETLTISGVEFECEIYLETNPGQTLAAERRVWYAKKYPFRIRVEDETHAPVEGLLEIRQPKAGSAGK